MAAGVSDGVGAGAAVGVGAGFGAAVGVGGATVGGATVGGGAALACCRDGVAGGVGACASRGSSAKRHTARPANTTSSTAIAMARPPRRRVGVESGGRRS